MPGFMWRRPLLLLKWSYKLSHKHTGLHHSIQCSKSGTVLPNRGISAWIHTSQLTTSLQAPPASCIYSSINPEGLASAQHRGLDQQLRRGALVLTHVCCCLQSPNLNGVSYMGWGFQPASWKFHSQTQHMPWIKPNVSFQYYLHLLILAVFLSLAQGDKGSKQVLEESYTHAFPSQYLCRIRFNRYKQCSLEILNPLATCWLSNSELWHSQMRLKEAGRQSHYAFQTPNFTSIPSS